MNKEIELKEELAKRIEERDNKYYEVGFESKIFRVPKSYVKKIIKQTRQETLKQVQDILNKIKLDCLCTRDDCDLCINAKHISEEINKQLEENMSKTKTWRVINPDKTESLYGCDPEQAGKQETLKQVQDILDNFQARLAFDTKIPHGYGIHIYLDMKLNELKKQLEER